MPTTPNLTRQIKQAQREIREEIAAGRYTADEITTFSDLHDHVDANDYGGLCNDDIAGPKCFPDHETWMTFGNALQDAIDAWIVKGGHR